MVTVNLALVPQPGLPVERDAAFWVERLRADWARFEAEWQSHVALTVLLVIGLDDARGGQVGRRVGPGGRVFARPAYKADDALRVAAAAAEAVQLRVEEFAVADGVVDGPHGVGCRV